MLIIIISIVAFEGPSFVFVCVGQFDRDGRASEPAAGQCHTHTLERKYAWLSACDHLEAKRPGG